MENLENRKMRDYDELLLEVLKICELDSYFPYIRASLEKKLLEGAFKHKCKKCIRTLINRSFDIGLCHAEENTGIRIEYDNKDMAKIVLFGRAIEMIKNEKSSDVMGFIINTLNNDLIFPSLMRTKIGGIFLRLLNIDYLDNLLEILLEINYLSRDAFIEDISSYVSEIYYKSCVFYNNEANIEGQVEELEWRRDSFKRLLEPGIRSLYR